MPWIVSQVLSTQRGMDIGSADLDWSRQWRKVESEMWGGGPRASSCQDQTPPLKVGGLPIADDRYPAAAVLPGEARTTTTRRGSHSVIERRRLPTAVCVKAGGA